MTGLLTRGTDRRIRLLVVPTHPIQYHAPLYRRLARSEVVDLRVLYLSDFGLRPAHDPGFGRTIAYDTALTDGFRHDILGHGKTSAPRPLDGPPLGLLRFVSRKYADAIVVHGYSSLSSWSACGLATARGIPYLMRGESQAERDLVRGLSQGRPLWRRALRHGAAGPLVRRAGACLAIGQSNETFYRDHGVPGRRIVRAPYSVDNGLFSMAEEKREANKRLLFKELGLDPSLPTVLFAAKFQDYKRPFDVLEAVGRARVVANLLMVGDGPLRPALVRKAAGMPRVRVTGFVNQSKLAVWYGASDILVLPSSREPWGLVVNEAMAAGVVPVVSDSVGCAPDLVAPSDGMIFPTGDIGQLASALDRLMADPEGLRRSRQRSKDVVARHSIEATVHGFEAGAVIAVTRGVAPQLPS